MGVQMFIQIEGDKAKTWRVFDGGEPAYVKTEPIKHKAKKEVEKRAGSEPLEIRGVSYGTHKGVHKIERVRHIDE